METLASSREGGSGWVTTEFRSYHLRRAHDPLGQLGRQWPVTPEVRQSHGNAPPRVNRLPAFSNRGEA